MKKNNLIYLYLTLIIVFVIVALIITYYVVVVRKKNAVSGSASISPGTIRSILFIGDSNTAADFSYADIISAAYPNIKTKKIAQNGAKTDWMFLQLQTELSKTNYDAVAILGGSNDIYATDSIQAAKSNLDAMYRLAHNKGIKVLTITPPNKDFYVNKTDHKQAILKELVSWIKNTSNKDAFVDFWTLTNNRSYFSANDGYLHPQRQAHQLLANATINALKLK